MASKRKAATAAGATAVAKGKPYVQRVLQDEELRDNVATAYQAAREAYGRVSNGKAPTRTMLEDKKFQKRVAEAAVSLRDAGAALREGPQPKKRRLGPGRLLLLGIVGAGVGLVASEGLRNKVLDALFGKEEEFEYSSTTTPSTPAPSGAAA
jgi:hypothetical protein